MSRGRTDEPLMTEADVRQARSRRMAGLIRKLFREEAIGPEPSEDDDNLALWISRCLQAHELDTLSFLMDMPKAKKAMKALEKVMDLMKYLLKLKYQYLAAQQVGKGGDKSPQEKNSGGTQLQGERVR